LQTFLHSGAMGDIVYCLPAMRALGGGVLYLDTTGGVADPYCRNYCVEGRTKLSEESALWLLPLLRKQPYVEAAELWDGQEITHNLNRMRATYDHKGFRDVCVSIAQYSLRAFGLDESDRALWPWLTAKPVKALLPAGRRTIVNRTPRYQSRHHWWARNAPMLAESGFFTGMAEDHELFQKTFRVTIPFVTYADAAELASAMKAADQVVGNQSFVMAVAIGLGVPFALETYDAAPDCFYVREKGVYL